MLTQREFDAEFITSAEIYREYQVSRASLHYARRRGDIPDGIYVADMMLWRRKELAPHLAEWIKKVRETKERQTPKEHRVNGG